MTEQEWLACRDIERMLQFIRPKISGRRKELFFAVACCRRMGQLLDDTCHDTLCALELDADDPMSSSAYEELTDEIMAHTDGLSYRMGTPLGCARWLAADAVWDAAEVHLQSAALQSARAISTVKANPDTFDVTRPGPPRPGDPFELAAQVVLLRCIVGNPFRPVAFDAAWRTDTAVTLARQMYEAREFGAMPILADALQDAGCDDEQVLSHCRDAGGTHVRGCWVVDLVLGK